jgi:hypothetical protein
MVCNHVVEMFSRHCPLFVLLIMCALSQASDKTEREKERGDAYSIRQVKQNQSVLSIHPMTPKAHIGPRPPLMSFLNLTLIDNW